MPFIVLEGIDGCGKTTQLKALRQALPGPVTATREPGGTALGQGIRELLLHTADPCPMAELLLYMADRAQHVETVIRPALERGEWVLCDRFTGSTYAYQGGGRGHSLESLCQLQRMATGGLVPDLVLWLDVSIETSLQRRAGERADRIESEGGSFLKRVRHSYQRQCCQPNWVRINGEQPAEKVTADCLDAIRSLCATV